MASVKNPFLRKVFFVALALGILASSTAYSQVPGGLQGLFQQPMDQSQALPSVTIRNTPSGQVPQNYVAPRPVGKETKDPNDPNYKEPTSDFERYVQGTLGESLKRFGSDLAKDADQSFSPPATAAIPDDYLIGPGDEIFLRTWGSLDSDLRLIVDRAGQVALPKIGAVTLSGVRHGDLNKVLSVAISKTYSGARVSASMGQLRGIRVYVTGYAASPGAYTVNNLSSLINVVMAAGGPSTAGSFRDIQLKRAGKTIAKFDLYDLLLKGDKSSDRPVTAEDVIYVGPAGAQVAIAGAVNKAAIFEIKPGDSLQDILGFAGGFASGAQTDSLNVLSLGGRRDGMKRIAAAAFNAHKAKDSDIYSAISDAALSQPIDAQARMVKVDGQVKKPGMYALDPHATLQDAIDAAGGLTPSAYLYGLRLERVSVRNQQLKNIEKIRSELKRQIFSQSAIKQTTAEDAQLAAASQERGKALLAVFEEFKPDGRLTIATSLKNRSLPEVPLESGDSIHVPPVPLSVSVLGSIPGGQVNLAYTPGKSSADYIKLAGGYSRGADKGYTYVVRASGAFEEANSWFDSKEIMPGDTIFVPENMMKTTLTKELKDWTQILYQLGLGATALHVLSK